MPLPKKMIKASKSRNERKDCAVKAIAIATKTPYDMVHDLLAAEGRRPGKGTPSWMTELVVTKRIGCLLSPVKGPYNGQWCHFQRMGHSGRRSSRGVTVGRLMAYLPRKGRFLVWTSGHILAVVDGKVEDWTDGRRHRVLRVAEVHF